jgi:hypothetical protein
MLANKKHTKIPLMMEAHVGALTRREGWPLSHKRQFFNLHSTCLPFGELRGVEGADDGAWEERREPVWERMEVERP